MTNQQSDCPSLKTYLSEIGRYPLLTPAEELELGRIIATSASSFNALKYNPKMLRTKLGLVLATITGYVWQNAVNTLTTCNLRLVVSVAKNYQGNNIPLIDLIQDGSIGLGRAAVKYDYKKGYKFSTYAYWWIKQGITRSISTQKSTIRIPIHRGDFLRQIRKDTRTLTQKLGRSPSLLEIAANADISIEELDRRILEAQPCISYDVAIGDGVSTIQDIAIGEESNGEDIVYLSQAKDVLKQVMTNLNDKERSVVIMRNGLYGRSPMSAVAVGRELDLSYEQIRQLSATAKRKMSSPTNRRTVAKFYA